jgi:hypothetical protein
VSVEPPHHAVPNQSMVETDHPSAGSHRDANGAVSVRTPITTEVQRAAVLELADDNDLAADGARTHALRSHNPPTLVSRRCRTLHNRIDKLISLLTVACCFCV